MSKGEYRHWTEADKERARKHYEEEDFTPEERARLDPEVLSGEKPATIHFRWELDEIMFERDLKEQAANGG